MAKQLSGDSDVTALNLRDIPVGLMRDLKQAAAGDGVSLKAWCVAALGRAVGTTPAVEQVADGPARTRQTKLPVRRTNAAVVTTGKPGLSLTTAAALLAPDSPAPRQAHQPIPISDQLASKWDRLAKPRPKFGNQCPHGYMNYMMCPDCQ